MKLENPSLINEDMYTENDMAEFVNCLLAVIIAYMPNSTLNSSRPAIITSL